MMPLKYTYFPDPSSLLTLGSGLEGMGGRQTHPGPKRGNPAHPGPGPHISGPYRGPFSSSGLGLAGTHAQARQRCRPPPGRSGSGSAPRSGRGRGATWGRNSR